MPRPSSTSGFAVCGVRSPKPGVDLPGRVVFLSFRAGRGAAGQRRRQQPRRRAAQHPELPHPGRRQQHPHARQRSSTPCPAAPVVEVEDRDLRRPGANHRHLLQPEASRADVTVTLSETVRRGLFRGSVALVPAGGGSGGPALVVQAGDTIRADYLDASANTVSSATAIIETTPPVITDVGSERITWLRSSGGTPRSRPTRWSSSATRPESLSPTNSLPINFTAYDPNLDTYHVLLLAGPASEPHLLLPRREPRQGGQRGRR